MDIGFAIGSKCDCRRAGTAFEFALFLQGRSESETAQAITIILLGVSLRAHPIAPCATIYHRSSQSLVVWVGHEKSSAGVCRDRRPAALTTMSAAKAGVVSTTTSRPAGL